MSSIHYLCSTHPASHKDQSCKSIGHPLIVLFTSYPQHTQHSRKMCTCIYVYIIEVHHIHELVARQQVKGLQREVFEVYTVSLYSYPNNELNYITTRTNCPASSHWISLICCTWAVASAGTRSLLITSDFILTPLTSQGCFQVMGC